jgi:hypothetical protein
LIPLFRREIPLFGRKIPLFPAAAEFPDDGSEINYLLRADIARTGAKQRFFLHFAVKQGNLAGVHAHARD